MIASVRGNLRVMVVPIPFWLLTSMEPRRASMLRFTTSIPTPRPETLVTCLAVEKPGAKISEKISCLESSVSDAINPFAKALDLIASTSRPAPSSVIRISTLAPECIADRWIVPCLGFPAASLTSGSSMP